MAQNTALQEFIDYINKDFEWFVKNSPDYGVMPKLLKKATELLPKERQQIIDAYENGTDLGDSENYFTNTFNHQ